MGLSSRKKSGRTIGGSRMIVDGQQIYSVIKYIPEIKKESKHNLFVEGAEPVTTTTTTIQVITFNIITQDDFALITQDSDNLVWD